MKSRISIDCDEQNVPFINIEYNHSDDLRDKMVKRFLENFLGSSLAKFNYVQYEPTGGSKSSIYPIPYGGIKEEIKVNQAWFEHSDRINMIMPAELT